ncbi:hypothetical protein HDU76_004634 [Blyttiomyces sp. JEL0837]|nr:hypothetical protein HDU76_004634 [Blyttiomyces sp. JEL0837]
MTSEKSNRVVSAHAASFLCQSSDVIIIGDTMPDARPIFQQLTSDGGCQAKIVVELTNRFDWEVGGGDGLYDLVKKLAEDDGRKYPNLFWVANNPWEARYLYLQTGAKINARLIRPVGYSSVKPGDDKKGDPKKAAIVGTWGQVQPLLKLHNIPFQEVGNPYGGPEGLKGYKAVVEFPYQSSTMKLYENVATGVVTLAPSAEFFEELVLNGTIWHWPWGNKLGEQPDWANYIEIYNSVFEPYINYFNSFSELSTLINDKTTEEIDAKNSRTKGPEFYRKVRKQSLQAWARLFRDMGFAHVESWD